MRARGPALPLRALYTRPLMLAALFYGLGALLARDGRLPQGVLLVCAAISLLAWCLTHLCRRRCAALLVAFALFFGAARMNLAVGTRPELEDRFSVPFSGTVADTPAVDAEIARLTCRLTDVFVEGEALGYDIRLYLRGDVSSLRTLAPGQRVEATGHLWAPDTPTNPGQFDFADYLWRNGMAAYATAQWADAAVLGEARGRCGARSCPTGWNSSTRRCWKGRRRRRSSRRRRRCPSCANAASWKCATGRRFWAARRATRRAKPRACWTG